MINHRQRLLLIGQADPDHRAVTRQHPPQLHPPRVPSAVPRVMPLPLPIGRPPVLRLGHQARTIAPGGRPRLSYLRQNRRLPRFALLLRAVTGGVDTHADVHAAAALDPVGGLLGVEEFPATPAGYARLLGWLGGFGTVCLD